jgi:hypothetical protein
MITLKENFECNYHLLFCLQILLNHHNPQVVFMAHTFDHGFTSRKMNVERFALMTFQSIFDKELNKSYKPHPEEDNKTKKKQNLSKPTESVPINFEMNSSLFEPNDQFDNWKWFTK